jgi:hypothetical protein
VQDLTIHNADEYRDLVEDFCLREGIQQQMEAFKGQANIDVVLETKKKRTMPSPSGVR